MGLIKDIRNYFFTRGCFKAICDDKVMRGIYSPRMTRLGVLYFFHKIPENTPIEYHDEVLIGHLMKIDETMIVMNMDGVVRGDYRLVNEDEDFYYYLIKFVPTFETIGWKWFIKLGVISSILYYIFVKFGLVEYMDIVIYYIKDFVNTISPFSDK